LRPPEVKTLKFSNPDELLDFIGMQDYAFAKVVYNYHDGRLSKKMKLLLGEKTIPIRVENFHDAMKAEFMFWDGKSNGSHREELVVRKRI
jgi:hypothetical protein